MTEHEVLAALGIGEDSDWEFKDARGGLPRSLWETYSGMANTDGGIIVLGVAERNGTYQIVGLPDLSQMRKSFWDTVNNRGKISVNLLTDTDVTPAEIDGRTVLIIGVPRADRRQRPVYEGQNPLTGAYRRNYEGDYKCRPDEVGRMLADQSEEPADSRILEGFGLDDLDEGSLRQYRQQFADGQPGHPWRSLDDQEFLAKIGAWRRDRRSRDEGLTVAGLLMFGKDQAIRDPSAVPEFHLDYRERLSDDPDVRWTDRLTYDGKWVCNVFQFFQRVQVRLVADLKLPFELDTNLFRRRDETIVHKAVREALVNALIHADHRGQGGIIIEKYRDRFEFSDPGALLIGVEQILRGGVSECRNRALQVMFSLVGYGERAGSGWDKIRQGWSSQNWRAPSIEETNRPDRVKVSLPMVSPLPSEVVEVLGRRFGGRYGRLGGLEVIALATALSEGSVSNRRMQELSLEHPGELTRLLQRLVNRGFLEQVGQKRGTVYRLVGTGAAAASGSAHGAGDSSHRADSSHIGKRDSSHRPARPDDARIAALRGIAAPAQASRRLPPNETRAIIVRLCDGRYLDAALLSELMARNPNSLRSRFLSPMVAEGLLVRRYPDEPNRPDQAYTTARR